MVFHLSDKSLDPFLRAGIFIALAAVSQSSLANTRASGPQPRCSDRFHQDSSPSAPASSICRQWRSEGPILERFPEGTSVPNPFRIHRPQPGDENELRRLGTVSERQRSDIATAFDEMKALLAERVRGGSPSAQLNERQRYLLRRLESTRLVVTGDDRQICPDSTTLDARHKPSANLIVMCPALANLPLEAIYETIAHELGHVVDSCNDHSYFPFTERVRTASQRGRTEPLLRECIPNREERLALAQYLEAPSRREARGVVIMTSQLSSFQDRLAQLRRCRLLSNTGYEAPAGQNPSPFASIERCSQAHFPNSRGVPSPIDAGESGIPVGKFPEPHPLGPRCHSQVQECFADHLGAYLLNSYLQAHPQRIRPGREHLLMYQGAAINCIEERHNEVEYPASRQRLAAFLQFERIQQASGCTGSNARPVCTLAESPGAAQGAPNEGAADRTPRRRGLR